MRTLLRLSVFLILFLAVYPSGGYAAEYTRFGAEAGGNATGEIPAFTGVQGLKCPANYTKGDFLPSPYKDDPVLFKIDYTNVDKYKDRLSPGQIAYLKKNKKFYMKVYRTVRNFEFPDEYYQLTEKNIKTAALDAKNVLRGFNGGLPFPYPKNGYEAMWNIKKPWAGSDLITHDCRRVVSPSGKVRKSIWTDKIMAFDETRLDRIPNPDGVAMKILSFYSFPADRAGEAGLSVNYIDDNKDSDIWSYIPSLRRVRRAPTLSGGTQLDGESTVDEMGFDFRAPINDWQWKLIGKKEIYVPANNFDMWRLNAKDEEECHAGGLNPEILRYELHRCWVVEGTPRPGLGHPYSKRVSYFDEDFWNPCVADRYDHRGNIWRMGEYFQVFNYCQRIRYVIGYIYHNLESGRYEVFGGCRVKGTTTNATDIGLKAEEFTVEAMRTAGH